MKFGHERVYQMSITLGLSLFILDSKLIQAHTDLSFRFLAGRPQVIHKSITVLNRTSSNKSKKKKVIIKLDWIQ